MKKKPAIFILTALVIILTDQIIKYFISFIEVNKSIPVIKNIFHITHINNYGAGFGLLQNKTMLLIFFSVFVIGLILYYYDRIAEKPGLNFSVALILGGTLSNLIDRIRLGYVIDYLDFRIWPSFNIADAAITIGAIVLLVYFIREK